MEYWLDQGLDGFRCDAVPYFFEREGTICENLPETHRVFERDPKRHRPALQRTQCCWRRPINGPADVRPYFGDGDECHMAFHFPLMPRLFMGVRSEDRQPIIDMFNHTPDIPRRANGVCFSGTTTN